MLKTNAKQNINANRKEFMVILELKKMRDTECISSSEQLKQIVMASISDDESFGSPLSVCAVVLCLIVSD